MLNISQRLLRLRWIMFDRPKWNPHYNWDCKLMQCWIVEVKLIRVLRKSIRCLPLSISYFYIPFVSGLVLDGVKSRILCRVVFSRTIHQPNISQIWLIHYQYIIKVFEKSICSTALGDLFKALINFCPQLNNTFAFTKLKKWTGHILFIWYL